jgi:hypothetical protein
MIQEFIKVNINQKMSLPIGIDMYLKIQMAQLFKIVAISLPKVRLMTLS